MHMYGWRRCNITILLSYKPALYFILLSTLYVAFVWLDCMKLLVAMLSKTYNVPSYLLQHLFLDHPSLLPLSSVPV